MLRATRSAKAWEGSQEVNRAMAARSLCRYAACTVLVVVCGSVRCSRA